mgnify:FL=1
MPRASRGYFSDFPQIEYQAKIARSIMARPRIASSLLSNPAAIYSYTVNNDLRPDQVAHLYYGDSELLWLIFLANNIVDPYYGWPLTQNAFQDFIISKYGTIANAKSTIKHYRYQEKDKATDERWKTKEIITKETYDLNGTFGTLRNITNAQLQRYQAVTAFIYEEELNESKRVIKVIDRRLAGNAKQILRETMIG